MGVQALPDLAAFQNAHTAAGALLVAIDFTAAWCGPCKVIGPVFESLATSGDFPFVHFFKARSKHRDHARNSLRRSVRCRA